MDDSEPHVHGEREVHEHVIQRRPRPSGDVHIPTGGSFDVLVAYDSNIQSPSSPRERSNRSGETLRELAGLSHVSISVSDLARYDYEEVPLALDGDAPVGNVHEIPVRDVDCKVSSSASVYVVPQPLETQPQLELFSSASLPPSPDGLHVHLASPLAPSLPQRLNTSDPLIEGDKNSARYLRILVPQQDLDSQSLSLSGFHHTNPHEYSRNASHNFSETDFDSLPSAAENLLLESPSDSPAHFSQLRLTLNSAESEGETFASLDDSTIDQLHSPNATYHRQLSRQRSHQQKVSSKAKGPEKSKVLESDLEKELRRLVVEIYSEKPTGFVTIGSLPSSGFSSSKIARDRSSSIMGDVNHPTYMYQDNSTPLFSATSPDVQRAQMAHDTSGTKPVFSGMDQSQTLGTSFSSISGPSSTADALALQRSVIGSSPTKPASMEEIAAAIAAAEKQYRQRLQHYKQQQQPPDRQAGELPNGSAGFKIDTVDEMPTRLPPTPPTITPHTEYSVNPVTDSSRGPPPKTKSPPVTTKVRPGSLVSQNTGLAVSSAVATRFKTPNFKTDHSHAAADHTNKERILFRSPVQAITTSRGGRTVAVHKPEQPKAGGFRESSIKKLDNQVVASAAEMKTLEDSEPEQLFHEKPSKPSQSFLAVTTAEDQFQVQEIGLHSDTDVILTRDPQSVGKEHLSSEESEATKDHKHPLQSGENELLPATTEDKSKQSFLGSIFQWGKKQDSELQSEVTGTNQAHERPSGVVSPSAATLQSKFPNKGSCAKSPYSGLGKQAVAESQDSGIDLAPAGSHLGDVFHAEFEPVHASTPVKGNHGSKDCTLGKNTPNGRNNRSVNPNLNQTDSDDETDSRIQATLQGPNREASGHQQYPVLSVTTSTPNETLGTIHAGSTVPVAGIRRRDLNKMPVTSLTSVYGTLKTTTPQYSRTPVDPDDLQSILREKANLEGRLETLAAETEDALQQRAEMQTHVASLQAQLKSHNASADMAQQHVLAMTNDLEASQQHHTQLEQAMSTLQSSLENKDEELDVLKRNLHASDAASQRLKTKMAEIRESAETKEATISKLKENFAAVQKEAENAYQERTDHLAELKTLQGDVQSLTNAKEWFEEQLQSAQEVRSKLQKDLRDMQNQAKKHGAAVEALKTEKAQLQHQLSDTRQQALREKELIAKHLETIEADFLARDAAFQDLQKEKVAVQEAVASRMDQMNEERSKLSSLIANCVELERQLDRTQKELADKQADVSKLDTEKKELVKRLALVQESLAARDKELEALREKCVDAEAKVQELQDNAAGQEGSLQSYRAEKASLETALATANQEKMAFDEALQNLRGDMAKVEQGFKQMKQDLNQKNAQMEALQRDKEEFQMQFSNAEEQLKHHQQSLESYQENMASKEDLVADLNRIKRALEDEVSSLKQNLEAVKKANKESQVVQKNLENELAHSQDELKDLENQLESAMTENAHLEGQLEMMADEQQRFSTLLDDNSKLKQKLAEMKSTTHRELADQTAQVLRLGSDLAATQKELKEKNRAYESTTGALTKKLKDAIDAKQAAEASIEASRQNEASTNLEMQDQLTGQLEATRKDLADAVRERNDLERQLQELQHRLDEETAKYREKVVELQNELQSLKELCEQQQRNEEANRRMALDLERERGRLAGIQQSHSALKQHANLLEAALGRRETTLAEMTAQMTTNGQEWAAKEERLRAKLKKETQAHKQEKEAYKTLQKQVAEGKAEIGRLQSDIQEQATVLEDTRLLQDRKAQELQALQQELTKVTRREEKQKVETEEVRLQLGKAKSQLSRLKRQLDETHSKDPVVAEQIKALEWESEQRGCEADALKEQLELAEHRQKIEMDNAQATIQMGRRELEALKAELAATRKEKFAYQGKLSQFKSALKATLQQNKLLKAKLRSRQKDKNAFSNPKMVAGVVAGGDVTMVPDDIIVPEISVDVEALLSSDDKDGITAANSKPLSALRGCLESVRDQMGGLQKQMDEHTSAVNFSNRAWKDVESKVRDLRKSCMTPIDGSSTSPATTSRRSAQASPTDVSGTHQTTCTNGSSRTPASMTFPSLPNVYDI